MIKCNDNVTIMETRPDVIRVFANNAIGNGNCFYDSIYKALVCSGRMDHNVFSSNNTTAAVSLRNKVADLIEQDIEFIDGNRVSEALRSMYELFDVEKATIARGNVQGFRINGAELGNLEREITSSTALERIDRNGDDALNVQYAKILREPHRLNTPGSYYYASHIEVLVFQTWLIIKYNIVMLVDGMSNSIDHNSVVLAERVRYQAASYKNANDIIAASDETFGISPAEGEGDVIMVKSNNIHYNWLAWMLPGRSPATHFLNSGISLENMRTVFQTHGSLELETGDSGIITHTTDSESYLRRERNIAVETTLYKKPKWNRCENHKLRLKRVLSIMCRLAPMITATASTT